MKVILISASLFLSNFSYACFVNREAERVASEVVESPENIKLTLTDKIDDWSKIMGGYIYFEKGDQSYAGYIRFDQDTCRALFSDIKEIENI